MGIADMIDAFIREMLEESGGSVEIQRGDVASRFECVPSQVTYVVTTRFSPERGYVVESKRGEGGYIRITQVKHDRACMMMHAINSIGDNIDKNSVQALLSNLFLEEQLDAACAAALMGATSDRALAQFPPVERDRLRASILKHALVAVTGNR